MKARAIARAYRGLGRDPIYVGLVGAASFSMAALFSYVSGSSFVLQDGFGLSEQRFGVVFGIGAVFLIGGTQLSAWLLRHWTTEEILLRSLVAAVVSAVALVAVAVVDVGGLPAVLAPLWAVFLFIGTAMPGAPALALSRHGEAAGTAAALLGAVRFGVGAAIAPFVGGLGNDALAMGTVILVAMVLAVACTVYVVRSSALEGAEPLPEITVVD